MAWYYVSFPFRPAYMRKFNRSWPLWMPIKLLLPDGTIQTLAERPVPFWNWVLRTRPTHPHQSASPLR